MNGKMIRKGVKIKKGGVLLALALSISVMFGNGITAEARKIDRLDTSAITVGDKLNGGDVLYLSQLSDGMITDNRLVVAIDDVIVYEDANEAGYTLPSGYDYCVSDLDASADYAIRFWNIYLRSTPLPTAGNNNGNNSNTPVQPEEETTNQLSSDYQSDAHEHSFSWVTVQEAGVGQDGLEEYRCACGLVEGRNTIPGSQAVVSQFKDMIVSAQTGEKISFDSGRFYTMSDSIIQKLAQRNDVSAEITFEYQGKSYKMTIPAGVDYTAILGDEENFYGYFYFAQLVGAVIEEI